MAQAQAQQAAQQRPGNFNGATRQNFIPGPTWSIPNGASNVTVTQDLPQTGYGAAINFFLSGQTNVPAASSTTVTNTQYPPPPWSYIKNFRLFNNQGVDLFSISGYGLYLWMMTQRSDFEAGVAHTGQFIGGFSPTVFAQYFQGPSTTGASATDSWSCMWRMDIAWGQNLQAGLQLLQDPGVRYSCAITFGAVTDLYSATTGTPTVQNVTIQSEVELYQIPANPVDQPKLNYAQIVLEDIQTSGFVAGGDLTYKLVTGNILCQVIHELSQGATPAPFSPANITRQTINYSQVQVPYKTPQPFGYFRQRRIYGRDLPPAVICHELQTPNGFPELKGGRDLLNLAQLTDANSLIGIASGAPLTNPQLRTIRTQLAANR